MQRTSGWTETRRANRLVIWLTVAMVLVLALAAFATGCSNDVSDALKAEQAGDLGTAATLYQEDLKAHPDDLAAIKGLAGILYMERRWDEALPVQEKAVAMDPKEAQIRVELGFNYLNHQNAAVKAVVVFKEASKLQYTAQYLGFLAQSELVAGDQTAAEATLREAVAVDKTYGRAYDLLIPLLEKQGRAAEADQVRRAAKNAGVALQTAEAARTMT